MKKFLLSTLLVGALLGMAACGNSGGDEGKEDGKQVTISFASWDPDQAKGLRKIADEFEKENENIKVDFETTPWDQYWTKMEAATTGGNMPDIVTMHSNESYRYMSNGMLMSLEDMQKDGEIDFDNYEDGIADLYTYKDERYAIPKDVTTVGLWYNKTLFDEAGVSYPDDTWTWDTFLTAAKKLTNADKGIYGYAAQNSPETNYFNFIYQNEGEVYKEDGKSGFSEENTIEAVEFYANLMLKEKVSPSVEILRETDHVALFQSGKVAMIMHGNWMATAFAANEYTAKNVDVAVLPKGKKSASMTNGLGWSISAKTEHPKETKKFLAFLSSEKANKMQAEEGVSIPAYKGLGQGWIDNFSGTFTNVNSFVDMLDYGVLRPFNNVTLKAETIANEELDKVFSGEEDATVAGNKISKQVNDLLKE